MLTRFKESNVKRTTAFVAAMFLCLVAAVVTSVIVHADSYYTVKIEYKYSDDSVAYDHYAAQYMPGDDVDLTVTNPVIPGYKPVTALEDGEDALTTILHYPNLSQDETVTVYYVPDLVHYKVRYFKQNIRDDLYTEDLTLSSDYYEKWGYTGTYPDELEQIEFDGFTNLFHEPDAIAADGSTTFKLYYDRDYVLIDFNLGDGGYGVEPVYAKQGSTFNVGTPKREGYEFLGWCKSNSNGDYLDNNGDVITEEQAKEIADPFTSGTVPTHNTFYKAVWNPKKTHYSIVYWMQHPDSELSASELNETESREEAQELISENYSVVSAKDIWNVDSGTHIDLNTTVQTAAGEDNEIWNLFGYNLNLQGEDSQGNPKTVTLDDDDPLISLLPEGENQYPVDKNNKKLDFPTMSIPQREELTGDKKNYYVFNEDMSLLQFTGVHEDNPKNYIEVAGDGSTRINVYFDRVDYKLQFFFAKTDKNATTGAITKLYLTSGTGGFSQSTLNKLGNRLDKATWKPVSGVTTLPQFNPTHADDIGEAHEYVVSDTLSFWYYEIKSRYNAEMNHTWFNDSFVPIEGKGDGGRNIIFTSWATEYGTKYNKDHTTGRNWTVKGYFERFSEDLMFMSTTSTGTDRPLTELHFLASWANLQGSTNIQNFTYKNYVEILPYERFLANQQGNDFLINGGDYNAGTYEGNYYRAGHYDGRYIDIIVNNGVIFGLLPQNNVETYDWGTRYDSSDLSTRNKAIRDNQTTVALKGFEAVPDGQVEQIYDTCGTHNPQSTWYAANGFAANKHADVVFLYRRNDYKLKYRNFNVLEHQYNAYYNAPLNLMKFQYIPTYPNEDLRDYYTFGGWYRDPFHLKAADFSTLRMPADDLTLYAKWIPVTNKVTFYNDYQVYSLHQQQPDNDDYQPINEVDVDYNTKINTSDVPSVGSQTYTLDPPDKNKQADFAGWYYIKNRKPVRFEPEVTPVTEAHELYAEWKSNSKAKYKISYVENDTGIEVAPPTTGTLFVSKTKTFTAKAGNDLNEAHRYSTDKGNWWPIVSSHSRLIEDNNAGQEYEPNTYSFEYIQKPSVWYQVQYIDSITGRELLPSGVTRDELKRQTNLAVVTEKAPFINGYVVERLTQSLVLSASLDENADSAKTEELRNNIITFLYTPSDTATIFQVNHYVQNMDGTYPDDDDPYYVETVAAQIGDVVSPADAAQNATAQALEATGYTIDQTKTKVEVDDVDLNPTPASIELNGNPTIIKVYYERNKYNYTIRYVDYEAEYKHNNNPATFTWDGEMYSETVEGDPDAVVGNTLEIIAPDKYQYDHDDDNSTPKQHYSRISDRQLELVIRPDTETPEINIIKVYYKKDTQKKLSYEIACDADTAEVFATLSRDREAVETQGEISGCKIYLTNENELDSEYEFLGWFSTPKPVEANRMPNTDETTTTYVPELPVADMTYYAVFKQKKVSMTVDLMYNDSGVYDPTDTSDPPILDTVVDGKGQNTGYEIEFQSPHGYISGTKLPLSHANKFTFSIDKYDDRLYKYEFADWYEVVVVDGNETIIRHDDIDRMTVSTDQGKMERSQHYIAMFKKIELADSVDSVIKYRFNTRTSGTKDFVIKNNFTKSELATVLDSSAGAYELPNDYIMERAPYESNHGEDFTWTDTQIEKTSSEKDGTMTTIVTAKQDKQKVYVHYRLTDNGNYDNVIQTEIGNNRGDDEKLAVLDMTGNDNFSYWAVRQSENGRVIAKCYDPWFTYQIFSNYWISPVFNEVENPETESPSINIARIDYSRNRWTDENGVVSADGTTDLMFSDYEVEFRDGENHIKNNPDYTVGVIFELCDQLEAGKSFAPEACEYVSNFNTLARAVKHVKGGGTVSAYKYDGGNSRKVQINQLSTSDLTNKDRLEVAKYYKNSWKMVNETETHTNRDAIMKVTAYMIKGDDVTFSNSVYVCLNDIGTKDLASNTEG